MKVKNNVTVQDQDGNSTKPLLSSRLFKFRAMTHKNNVMVCGDLINTPDNENRIIWFDEKHTYNERVQSSTIGQFTGLQDLNGIDIYEGDIIFNHAENGVCNSNVIVFFQYGFFLQTYLSELKREILPLREDLVKDIEVIGNIYQNPELL